VLFVGDDWAEDHHDIEVQDQDGEVLKRVRLPEGMAGMARFHEVVGRFVPKDAEPSQVLVCIETDRGPWVRALRAAGYRVFGVDPKQAARHREILGSSGPKATRATRTPWPTWSAPVLVSFGKWLGTPRSPRRSRS